MDVQSEKEDTKSSKKVNQRLKLCVIENFLVLAFIITLIIMFDDSGSRR